jgi:hypothetical protein
VPARGRKSTADHGLSAPKSRRFGASEASIWKSAIWEDPDFACEDNAIVDAMHICNAAQVVDRHVPSLVQLVWSRDGLKAALIINKYPHAIFDFEARRGYCRTGFQAPGHNWTEFDHTWDDKALDLFG